MDPEFPNLAARVQRQRSKLVQNAIQGCLDLQSRQRKCALNKSTKLI